MKKCFCLAVLLGTALSAAGATIAAAGKSDYAIVIPDTTPSNLILPMAELVQEAIRRCTGATLPIVREASQQNTPAIYLGQVQKLGPLPDMQRHECRLEMRGQDLYLFGANKKYVSRDTNHYRYYEMGEARAAAEFLRRFCAAEFLFPGPRFVGLSVEPKTAIEVPDDFRYAHAPAVTFNIGRQHGLYYDVFNGHYCAPWYGEYGGHNYYQAVPHSQYAEIHPEYFALLDGKRSTHGHLCISNPEVQKLILEEVIRHLDQGYQMVELSQTDGYRHCQCDNCKNLFNVTEPGEMLWILHRNIAEQVLALRPGKQVCIIAYGPTRTPPRTFRTFPVNVCIDLAPWVFDSMKIWEDYTVPGGFICYDYTFGSFNEMGFTPKHSLAMVSAHARNLHRDKIQGVYRSGWGDNFGLDGVFYYAWNQIIADPTREAGALLHDFCRRLFGPAAPEMERFYQLLNERMQVAGDNPYGVELDFNDPDLLANRRPTHTKPVALLLARWPLPVLDQLEALLSAAEQKWPQDENAQFFLPILRNNFDYLQVTLRTLAAMDQVNRAPTAANFRDLLLRSQARAEFIAALPWDKSGQRCAKIGEMLPYAGNTPEQIHDNGRLRAIINFPFRKNLEPILASGVNPCGRTLRTGQNPQQLIGYNPKSNAQNEVWEHPFFLSCTWTEEALQVKLSLPKGMPPAIKGEGQKRVPVFCRIFLGQDGWRKRFQGNTGWQNYTTRTKTFGVDGALGDEYNGEVSKGGLTITQDANDETLVTIPWSITGIQPVRGMTLEFNVYCQYSQQYGFIWEYNHLQTNWRNPCDRAGSLILE